MPSITLGRLSLSIAHLSATIENPRHLLISLSRSVVQLSVLYKLQVGVCEKLKRVFYVRAGYSLLRVYRVVGRVLSYIQGGNSFLLKKSWLYASSAIPGTY
ncbi:hypothetical protein L6452_40997 [Arctium lappa]|uniref:Uncharacterized protein n=1 Tax=Arctium lappa TaxID=4217 RepID=A0ACB8XN83_ARCLA|nr:hypothetical protein L6452_40997 [Arctium lappa]